MLNKRVVVRKVSAKEPVIRAEKVVGIDLGTTNSAVSFRYNDYRCTTAKSENLSGTTSLRSCIRF